MATIIFPQQIIIVVDDTDAIIAEFQRQINTDDQIVISQAQDRPTTPGENSNG